MEQDRRLVEAAAAIADGKTVDWTALEAGAADADRELIARLKSVEQVTRGHYAAAGESSTRSGLAALEIQDDTAPPTSWGPFTLVKRVGRGTFGDVYRARDPHLDRPIALKLLRKPEPGHPGDTAVIEEARLMARVRHPNVVTVFGADRIDGRVGVWMEFVEGRTLEDELKVHGPFSAADVARIGIDLCNALAAVHDAGLLHRDLKAQNVMRDTSGRIVLTDFGAGREASLAPDTAVDLAGTPLYIAPEVLAGGSASPQSEVYGLGVLLYHLATADFPVSVRGQTLRELRAAHEHAKDAPRYFPLAFPVSLALIIQRAIEPDPSVRFQSATEMAEALTASTVARAPASRGWLWRLKWLITPAVLAGAASGLIVSLLTPLRYNSQAVIQVVPAQVPADYTGAPASRPWQDRLTATQQTVLSRTRLQRVITEFGLYPEYLKSHIMEEVVEKLRNDIAIRPGSAEPSDRVRSGRDDTFTVSFTYTDPVATMKVAEKLAAYFRDESQVEGERRAEGTSSFLEAQTEEMGRRVAEQQKSSAAPGRKDDRRAQLDREVVESTYKQLLAQQQQAEMRVNLERRLIGEQFVLVDQARLPERPINPSRAQMAGSGALGGLALGLLLSAVAPIFKRRPARQVT